MPFVKELNQFAMPTEDLLIAEYAFQVAINPHHHPMFDRCINHLVAMLVSLSNTCGGVVYLTGNPGIEVTKDKFDVFHQRLAQLVCSETKLPQEMMEVRQLENHKAWGCIIVEKSQHKLSHSPLHPTPSGTMVFCQYWNDILGFIHARGAVSEDKKEPIVQGNQRSAAETLEASIPDDLSFEDDDAVESFIEGSIPEEGGSDGTPDSPEHAEENIDFSSYSKLDWSNNKRDWENYVKSKRHSLDDIIESCQLWKPASPMRVTPDVAMLHEVFGSEAERSELFSRVATEEPGFAIVCKTWSFMLPEDIYQRSPEGRVCDVLTVSQTGQISFWVILDAQCETVTTEHKEYMMKTARMVKYQLVERSYPDCLKLHIHCHLVRTNGGDIEYAFSSFRDQMEEMETLFSQVCKHNTEFDLLQRALAVNILSKEGSLKQCVGDQASVTLSARQAEVLMHKAKVNYISGPAGSGKSLIAFELYKMHGGHKSIYICTTQPFLEFLSFNGCSGTLIQSDRDLFHEIRSGTFRGKECVIIDDSHNFTCSKSTVKELFHILKDQNEMSLFVFADNDYQSFDRKRQEAVYDCFHSLTREVLGQMPQVYHLTEIYRNSRKIVSFVQSAIQDAFSGCQTITCANLDVGEGIECIKVEDLWESTPGNEFVAYLNPLLSSELYRPAEIAILLDVSYAEEKIDQCRHMLTQHFPQVKLQTAAVFPRAGVVVDSVMSFLGLDASLCIFILPQVQRKSKGRNLVKGIFQRNRNAEPDIANPYYRVFLASRATHKAVFIVPQIDSYLVTHMKFDQFQVRVFRSKNLNRKYQR